MVKFPKEFKLNGEMVKIDPVNGSVLSDAMVESIARIFIREARGIVPSEERLEKMLSELDRMHEFMKNGTGEDDFDCTVRLDPLKVVKRDAGVYLKLHGRSRFLHNENIDDYIGDLKAKYSSPDYRSLEHRSLGLLDYELKTSVKHGDVVFLERLPISMETVERIRSAIKEVCHEA